jgi:hypothetical protein
MKTMTTSPDEQLREAHVALNHDLAELEGMLNSMMAVPADRLAERLRTFRGAAAKHFLFEEENGYLSPVVSCGHEKEIEVRALLDEHRRLLATLDRSIADAEAGTGLTDELRDRLRHWLREFRGHEAREIAFFEMARDDEPC